MDMTTLPAGYRITRSAIDPAEWVAFYRARGVTECVARAKTREDAIEEARGDAKTRAFLRSLEARKLELRARR